MSSSTIAQRVFHEADQQYFSRFSADSNPMHMDAIAARRTQAGQVVVHGIHVFLWAMDTLINRGVKVNLADTVNVRFNKFVFLETTIRIAVVRSNDKQINIEILDDTIVLASIKCKFGKKSNITVDQEIDLLEQNLPTAEALTSPAEYDISALQGLEGKIEINCRVPSTEHTQFPSIEKAWGIECVRSIAQLSTLVGMHCPGLHSIFSSFSLAMDNSIETTGLHFRTRNTDSRFNLVNTDVVGSGFTGTVEAFVRQSPLQLPQLSELATFVPKGCFESINALIVGGSRGLGEATARLIAAGNGTVTITYANGKADALKLQKELNSDRNCCSVLKFDAYENTVNQLKSVDKKITHLFYFATPQIFRQNKMIFDSHVMEEFMQFYVYSFNDLCSYLSITLPAKKLTVFYPSSVAVDQRPKGLTEYAMAKSAGEILCNDLECQNKLEIYVERLPRVNTDQTATVTPAESDNPITLMYGYLNKMIDIPLRCVG